MSEVPCRGCGMKIEFVKSATTGKAIPLQRIRRIYSVVADEAQQVTELDGVLFVSHFETCPQAASFSRPRKEQG